MERKITNIVQVSAEESAGFSEGFVMYIFERYLHLQKRWNKPILLDRKMQMAY